MWRICESISVNIFNLLIVFPPYSSVLLFVIGDKNWCIKWCEPAWIWIPNKDIYNKIIIIFNKSKPENPASCNIDAVVTNCWITFSISWIDISRHGLYDGNIENQGFGKFEGPIGVFVIIVGHNLPIYNNSNSHNDNDIVE